MGFPGLGGRGGAEQGGTRRPVPRLFKANTVDKVLEHLLTRGQKVAGGDRLEKTIVFARGKYRDVILPMTVN